MRREAIKAFVGFFCLGIILGGLYMGLEYVIGEEEDNLDEARRNYWVEREQEDPPPEWPQDPEPVVVEEEPAVCPQLAVRGRILDEQLQFIAEDAYAAADGGDPVRLVPADGWLSAPGFTDVTELSLSIPHRAAAAGPFRVGASGGAVRFNWVVAHPGSGLLSILDIASVEIGAELRVAINGKTELPDGAKLFAALRRGKRRWTGQEIIVKEGTFQGVLTPPERGYPSGLYTVSLEFNPLVQNRYEEEEEGDGTYEVIDEEDGEYEEEGGADDADEQAETNVTPQEAAPDAAAPSDQKELVYREAVDLDRWAPYDTCEVWLKIYIGDPEREPEERTAELNEYAQILYRSSMLSREFMVLRSLVLTAKGTPWALSQRADRAFMNGVPHLIKDKRLDVARWRYWMDEKINPRVDRFVELVEAREVPAFVELYMQVDAYVDALKKFVRLTSRRAYAASYLEPDPRDFCIISLSLEDEEAAVLQKLMGLRAVIVRKLRALRSEHQADAADDGWAPIK